MSDPYEQSPFSAITLYDPTVFAENPEPRCPCLLLLDTSGSMNGRPITELNAGLALFKEELLADSMASKRVEIAIVSFGPVQVETDFQTPDLFVPPYLQASGDTPMGAAIDRGLGMLRARKDAYKLNGIDYYRPWIFLITDGGPTDGWHHAANQIKQGEDSKQFQFFAVGVEGANFDILRQISVREPLKLKGLKFQELFSWLSSSLGGVSHSQVGQHVAISNPAAPGGWGIVG